MNAFSQPTLPNNWIYAKVADIADILYGDGLRSKERAGFGAIPVYGSGGVIGEHNKPLHDGPSVIIGRKGTVGAVYYEPGPFWCIDTAFYLDNISPFVDTEYLAYALGFIDLSRLVITVGVPGINRQDIAKQLLPLPPFPEQLRIVAIIRQVDALRQERHEANQRAQQLIPALFQEMFGDPVDNPKHWPVVPVSNFVKEFQGGKSILSNPSEKSESKYRVLKVSAVTKGYYEPYESKPVPIDYVPEENHFVHKGDLLFSRANTAELVGATAYVFDTPKNVLLPDKIWRFVWHKTGAVEPLYIWALFQSASMKHQLGKLATGTSGSMKNISMLKLLSLRVPLPPLSNQSEFANRVLAFQEISREQSTSYEQLNTLFHSILLRAFTGDLTAAWREQHAEEIYNVTRQQDRFLSQNRRSSVITVFGEEKNVPVFTFNETHPRYFMLRDLSDEQLRLYQAALNIQGFFTPQSLIDNNGWDVERVQRGLMLLATAGLLVRVSVPVNPDGRGILYRPAYRTLRTGEDTETVRDADLQMFYSAYPDLPQM